METTISPAIGKKIQTFTDLLVWQEGHSLVIMIYKITQSFPPEEQYGLTNQIRRAAVSVTSNIAEGFRRRGIKEKRQFYITALTSLTEVENQLLISRDIDYLSQDDYLALEAKTNRIERMLNGLIKSAMNWKEL